MTHAILIAILIAAGLVLAWCLFVLASPVGTCTACDGEHVIRKGRRARACKRCKATGRAPRPGARLVHAAVWSVLLGDRMDGRRKDIAARLKEESRS